MAEEHRAAPVLPAGHAAAAARYRATFRHCAIGIAHTTLNGDIFEANAAFCAVLGIEEPDLAGRRFPYEFLIVDPDRDATAPAAVQGVARLIAGAASVYTATEQYRHEDGHGIWVHRIVSLVSGDALAPYLVHLVQDVTARRQAEEQERLTDLRYQRNLEEQHEEAQRRLAHLAHYDQLTGLPNRRLYYERLTHGVAHAARGNWSLAVVFIDLDRFKTVNDTMGHMVGDTLLHQVATRLLECVRAEDTVSRLSSDEFAIVLAHLKTAQDAGVVAAKILRRLKEPYHGSDLFISASAGIALYPQDARDADTLMRNADIAMNNAKPRGDAYHFFTAEMNVRATTKLQLESRLRGALERNEFVLHYQPKVDIETGRICGFEALLRWQPPGEALVQPNDFIPVLEETGMIAPVGEWVVKAACAQISAWRDAGFVAVPIAINLSARQFRYGGFQQAVSAALREYAVEPRLIEIEVTESSIMENPDESHAVLEELKSVGVSLAIDDFGTGYSSLGYLKRFPFDTLKIDRSFVRDIGVDPEDAMIARTIIALAATLGLTVVAEGVESDEQFTFLAAHRCEQAQGFLFSRPVPAPEASELLKKSGPLYAVARRGTRVQTPAVLVFCAERDRLIHLQQLLQRDGYHVLTASRVEDAVEVLEEHSVVAAVVDEACGRTAAVEFLRKVESIDPKIVRVMLDSRTEPGSPVDAVAQAAAHRNFDRDREDLLLREEIRKIMRRNYRPPARVARGMPALLKLRRRRGKA
jgi:diguanylate cyclase (GGDEF)-like protein/PAS domain S-box-containing protein